MNAIDLRILASKSAREDAEKDLRFSGDDAIAKLKLNQEQASNLRAALLFYAESGASRAVSFLKLHGHLKA